MELSARDAAMNSILSCNYKPTALAHTCHRCAIAYNAFMRAFMPMKPPHSFNQTVAQKTLVYRDFSVYCRHCLKQPQSLAVIDTLRVSLFGPIGAKKSPSGPERQRALCHFPPRSHCLPINSLCRADRWAIGETCRCGHLFRDQNRLHFCIIIRAPNCMPPPRACGTWENAALGS